MASASPTRSHSPPRHQHKPPHLSPAGNMGSGAEPGSPTGRRRRSNTYCPHSPVPQVRTAPRRGGGTRIVVELVAAKLEVGPDEDVHPQAKMSICRTVNQRGVPVEETVRRSNMMHGSQPAWHEKFEFPAMISEGTFFVCCVNNKVNGSSKRMGLVAIPTQFFQPFHDDTVVDNWFPLKLGHDRNTGEVHLRLRMPGGAPSQVGKAFKVTGVKMDTRKLMVEVIEGEVPPNEHGQPRSTYVKLALPNREDVYRETSVVEKSLRPKWNEAFEFMSEVKNTQFMLVKLKNNKLLSHKTIGVAKIPLLFFLSLKEETVIDNWFSVRDYDGKNSGRVRVRLLVMPKGQEEQCMGEGRTVAFESMGRASASPTYAPDGGRPQTPTAASPKRPKDRKRSHTFVGPPRTTPLQEEDTDNLFNDDVTAEDEEQLEEATPDGDDFEDEDTWNVDEHHEDFAPFSPVAKRGRVPVSGGVFWPPPSGHIDDPSLVCDDPGEDATAE
ncbi:hypothetical protein DIPPA_06824 [Diplonema papillatum]|nr:hypothetical protein DIPPA_06824 [Diplonema papillatum]